jgi:hypothetical protein
MLKIKLYPKMEQSFTRPSLSGFFSDSRIESRFIIEMNNLEAMTQYWKKKFEEEQSAKQMLVDELADELSAKQKLVDELAEEQSALQYFANKLEKESSNLKKIAYELSKEKSVSHRLRLERIIYMMCFSFGAISILIYDLCSKLN